MSKRITTRTEITDHDLAVQTLKASNYQHRVDGRTISITSGKLAGARIDTTSGNITGDEDHIGPDDINALKQSYGEMKIRNLIAKQGGQIVEERTVNRHGEIVMVYQIG